MLSGVYTRVEACNTPDVISTKVYNRVIYMCYTVVSAASYNRDNTYCNIIPAMF